MRLKLLHIPTAIKYDSYWISESSLESDPEQWLCIRSSILLDSDEDLAVFPADCETSEVSPNNSPTRTHARAYEFTIVR